MRLFILLLLLTFFSLVSAQHSLMVEVVNIKEVKGQVQVCLFKDGVGYWKQGKPIHCEWIDVIAEKHTYTFLSITSGEYAVIVIQDLNENKDLDTNFLGIPSEPYGFSNNPSTTFGPPDFENAAFVTVNDKNISIKLK